MVLAGCFGHVFSDMEIEYIEIFRKNMPTVFQLGHVFSDMEIGLPDTVLQQDLRGVSIGPRLFRHGNSRIEGKVVFAASQGAVSIGPRLFRHGNSVP